MNKYAHIKSRVNTFANFEYRPKPFVVVHRKKARAHKKRTSPIPPAPLTKVSEVRGNIFYGASSEINTANVGTGSAFTRRTTGCFSWKTRMEVDIKTSILFPRQSSLPTTAKGNQSNSRNSISPLPSEPLRLSIQNRVRIVNLAQRIWLKPFRSCTRYPYRPLSMMMNWASSNNHRTAKWK